MMRVCHLDTCPVGIATQNPVLRKRFTGRPEFVEAFFLFLAEEVREYLAALGLRSLDEAIGRVDLLDVRPAVAHWKAHGLDLSPVLHRPTPASTAPGGEVARRRTSEQDHGLDRALDVALIAKAAAALEHGTPVAFTMPVRNEHRSVGAMLGGELVRRHGGKGLPDGTIDITLRGSAGQSFGAFAPSGVTLRLHGDANDYVGKGLSGARLVVRPDETAPFVRGEGLAEDQIIAGNTILYGATGGELFVRGRVGERFAVRNSGAAAVVEGIGDHGCEYMTGGTVVVLGPTGRNFAAGMSGGFAYVWRLDRARVNQELVDLVAVTDEHAETLRSLVELHRAETGSPVAERLLDSWPQARSEFTAVVPRDFQRVVRVIRAAEAAGRDIDETIMAELAALASSPPPAGSPSVAAGIGPGGSGSGSPVGSGSGSPVASAAPMEPADETEAEVAHA
jgi:glutamate synthase (NADPH/NADH) large chain